MIAPIDHSTMSTIAKRLVRTLGRDEAHRAVDIIFSQFSTVELAALRAHWPAWARTKQLAPTWDHWQSWGFLAGRGFGKTYSMSQFVNQEVAAGRAKSIGLSAQNEDNAIALLVTDRSGLIATAPPWNRPHWIASSKELHWPNGAVARVRTPEVPGAIRGFEYDLAWLSELQSWPTNTCDEAWKAWQFTIRQGYARTIWDATAKKGNKFLIKRLEESARDPNRFVVVRGTSHENAWNMAAGRIAALEAEYGGTRAGREELYADMSDDDSGALVKRAWIDKSRRPHPDVLVRRAIGIDPAVTTRAGNDRTGIVDAGLAPDGQLLVMGDLSGRHTAAKWGDLTVDTYIKGECDCVVVETNKGGDLVTQVLRAAAAKKNWTVIVLGAKERPRHTDGILYVREVHARGVKSDRFKPIATAYEAGRVSHVDGVDLVELEEVLTTWEPEAGQRSPDALDALGHVGVELLDLGANKKDPKRAFEGFTEASRAVANHRPTVSSLPVLFGGTGRGNRL